MIPKSYPHTRTKPKARAMNAAEKRHADRLAENGCLICRRPGQIHHEYSLARGQMKSHSRIVCLCREHHQRPFEFSRHQMGRDKFDAYHGVDIAAEAGFETVIREKVA